LSNAGHIVYQAGHIMVSDDAASVHAAISQPTPVFACSFAAPILRFLQLLRLWFSHPAVKGIMMWGWWDANIFSTNAGLYKANKQPKKAAVAVQQLWGNEFSTKVDVQQPPADAKVSFKGFFGTYGYEYTGADGGVVRGTLQLTRKQPQYSLADAGPQKEL
jgi:hypothetical protein